MVMPPRHRCNGMTWAGATPAGRTLTPALSSLLSYGGVGRPLRRPMQDVFSMNLSESSTNPSVSDRRECSRITYERVGQVEMS